MVVDRDFFTRLDIAQSDEKNVTVKNLHVSIGLAGMIDVVRTVSTSAAIQTPTIINCTDAQFPPRSSAIGLGLCYPLACVLCNFSSPLEVSN